MRSTQTKKTNLGAGSDGVTGAAPEGGRSRRGACLLKIRDVSLFADVIGHGYPLLLMHGGPSLDHWSLFPFRQLAGQFTKVPTCPRSARLAAAAGPRRFAGCCLRFPGARDACCRRRYTPCRVAFGRLVW
jgi:hypothetical protein